MWIVFVKQVILMAIFLLVTWFLTKKVSLNKNVNNRSMTRYHCAVTGIICYMLIMIMTILFAYVSKLGITINNKAIDKSILQYIYNSILIAIPLIMLFLEKSELKSIGIKTSNLIKAVFLGLLFSVIFLSIGLMSKVIVYSYEYNSFFNLKDLREIIIQSFAGTKLIFPFIMVGISEELAFRGYIQTRISSQIGNLWGVIITALLFAMLHMPTIIVRLNVTVYSATIYAISLIPISIVLGYVFLKTKNLILVSIIHISIDIVGLL
jgi:uncharacterized protein